MAADAAAQTEFPGSELSQCERAAVARAGPPPTAADYTGAQASDTLLHSVLLTRTAGLCALVTQLPSNSVRPTVCKKACHAAAEAQFM